MAEVHFEVQNHLTVDVEFRTSDGNRFIAHSKQAAHVNLSAEASQTMWVVIGEAPAEPIPAPAPSQEATPDHRADESVENQ